MMELLDALADVATLAPRGDGLFEVEVPDGWQHGRGAYGGLVVGLLAVAVEAVEDPTVRPIRTLSATLGHPVAAGAATLRVTVGRRGKSLSTLTAQLHQGGVVAAEGLFVCSADRTPTAAVGLLGPPTPERWATTPVIEVDAPGVPRFTRHLEFRNTGAVPFSGATAPTASGWIRPRTRRRTHDTFELVCLTDAWWPAALCAERTPVHTATVSFQWSRYATPTGDAPLYHEGRVLAAGGGFFSEERALFTADGALVVLNHQTFAVS
jgi:hypothetical protein